MSVYFPQRGPTGDGLLREDTRRLAESLGPVALGDVIQGVTIGTTVTTIPHGLKGQRPRFVFVMPYSAVVISRPQPPDSDAVYLQAASAAVCDILVIP